MTFNAISYFREGGTLEAGFPSYIERKADNDLLQFIKEGKLSYILTARQMGKSSVCIKTQAILAKEGYKTSYIDITSYGNSSFTVDNWYRSVLETIASDLGVKTNVDQWWTNNNQFTPIFRFFTFLKRELAAGMQEDIVIFIDEIDSLLKIDRNIFNPDDFFAAIRSLYNERAKYSELKKINFVIVGVASPDELMKDKDRTPFNNAKAVALNNFTVKEMEPFKKGLASLPFDTNELLEQIYFWTNGQPVLSQILCVALLRNEEDIKDARAFVKHSVDEFFINCSIGENSNSNLFNIQKRITDDDTYGVKMLQHYSNILKYGFVKEDFGDVSQIFLKLTGLVRKDKGNLVVNNNIYKSKLNQSWVVDINSQINRPFNAALKDWVDNNKSQEKAILGEELIKFNDWCNSRNDLSIQEKEFQNFSNTVQASNEVRKEMLLKQEMIETAAKEKIDAETRKFEAEREKNESSKLAFEAERKKNESRKRNYLIFFSLLAAIIVLGSVGYYTSFKKSKQQERILAKQKDSIARVSVQITEAAKKYKEIQAASETAKQALNIKQRESDMAKNFLAETKATIASMRKQEIILKRQNQDKNDQIYSKNKELADQTSLLESVRESYSILNLKLDPLYKFKTANPWVNYFGYQTDQYFIKDQLDSTKSEKEKDSIILGYKLAASAIDNQGEDPNYTYFLLTDALKKTGNNTVIQKYIDSLQKQHIFYSRKKKVVDQSIYSYNNTYIPISNEEYFAYNSSYPDSFYIYSAATLEVKNAFKNPVYNESSSSYSYFDYYKFCYSQADKIIHILSPKNELMTFDYSGNLIHNQEIIIPTNFDVYYAKEIYYKSKNEIFLTNISSNAITEKTNNENLLLINNFGAVTPVSLDPALKQIQAQLIARSALNKRESPVLTGLIYLPDLKKFFLQIETSYTTYSTKKYFFYLMNDDLAGIAADITYSDDEVPYGSLNPLIQVEPYYNILVLKTSYNKKYITNIGTTTTTSPLNVTMENTYATLKQSPDKRFLLFNKSYYSLEGEQLLDQNSGQIRSLGSITRQTFFVGPQLLSIDKEGSVLDWDHIPTTAILQREELYTKYIKPFEKDFMSKKETQMNDFLPKVSSGAVLR